MTYLERRIPADVPLHRGVVGAMGLSSPADTFRPYFYGASPIKARPRRAYERSLQVKAQEAEFKQEQEKEQETEAAKVKRYAQMKRDAKKRQQAERMAKARQTVAEYEQRNEPEPRRLIDISDESTWLAPVIPLFKTTEFPETPARASKPKVRFTHVHVAPADIEALLNDDD